ncbi:protein ADM2 [Bombina bombina]|uniref:protein ADM2 n=1 Tax=Bombina bombina TaxID=8345 RepID=UPI00235ABCD4|nr:protein ADM2 [Bombina bombina]
MSWWMPVSYISLLCLHQLPAVPLLAMHPTARNMEVRKELTDLPEQNLPLSNPATAKQMTNVQPLRRKRRRTHHSHGPRLMRVGCSLGTCQVQNLSYRLYQLMRQSGKKDSPAHLSSPQGYG